MKYDFSVTTVAQMFEDPAALAVMRDMGLDPDQIPRSPISDQMTIEQATPYSAAALGADVVEELNKRLLAL